MQKNNRKKKLMVKKFLVRMDEETVQAVLTIEMETGRTQADSVRWAVRQTAKALKTVSELQKA